MQHKKISFIVIIILLIIFVPLAIYSTTMRYLNRNKIAENNATDNREFKHEGKLYFYDDENLIGSYTCENFSDYCDYAVNSINYEYDLAEYKVESREKTSLIKNKYVFLMDSSIEGLATADIILYDVVNEKELNRFIEVKNYGIGIDNNTYIAKDKNGLWGVLEFNDEENVNIPFAYSYIGIATSMDKINSVNDTAFAILEQDGWSLVDKNNIKLTNFTMSNLFTYNNKYIVTIENGLMHLIDYNGVNSLPGNYKYLNFYDDYIVVVDSNDNFYLYNLETNEEVSRRHTIDDPNKISIETEDNTIKIFIAGDLSETVAIS